MVAYNDAFRYYKNFYFSTIKEALCRNDDPPGLQELSRCTFHNSIKEEATDQLAQLLKQELPITYNTDLHLKMPGTETSEAEYLAQAYKHHHLYLRAVRKFYYSRLVKKNYKYQDLACSDGKSGKMTLKMTSSQVPPLPSLRTHYRQEFQVSSGSSSSSDTFIDPNQGCSSLRWQMSNRANSDWSHWPANLIDQNFFIELANFECLHEETNQQIGACVGEFAKVVHLDAQLEPFKNSPYIGKREQRKICKHIVQQFHRELEEETQRRETTSSPKLETAETAFPEAFPLDMSVLEESVEEALSPKPTVIIGRPSHFGSTSMNYYGNDTFLNVSFVLIFGGYLIYIIFKIYEFFGLKKYTKPTSVKDCLFKLAEKKKKPLSKNTSWFLSL